MESRCGGIGDGPTTSNLHDGVEVAIDPGICQPRSQAFSEQVIEGQKIYYLCFFFRLYMSDKCFILSY